jgi:succinyl-diaminopimelate desuccinylase
MTNDQLIEKTMELIAIPSTADNPAALRQAIDVVAAILKDNDDITIEWFERNQRPSFLAYRGSTRPTVFDVLLNAHLDVVPGPPELFKPRIEGERLYGRGALDMKSTAVVLADLFNSLVSEVPYALGLQIVTDEEIGGYDGVRMHIDDGVRSKFVVMGEYANDRNAIYNAARGLCWAEIAFKGKTAHGGHLWHGENAVIKAGSFASEVLKRYPTPDKETWTTTASIANLSTPNETFNKVPDAAILKIDFRFTQEDPVFESRESLEAFIAGIDPDAELVNLATFEPAVYVQEANPYVQGLSAAMRKVTRKKPRYLGRPASSDGRHYALVNNDIIEFGLYGMMPHSDHEYVELSSFQEYRSIMEEFLRNPVRDHGHKLPIKAKEPLRTKLLRQLVAMPTISGDHDANNRALSFVQHFLASRGMYVERYQEKGFGSLLATTTPGNKQPSVLLTAHIDVVPGEQEQFKLEISEGRIYGRGVMDMKFAIANYLELIDILHDNLEAYDIGILITSDEELGGRNGTNTIVNSHHLRPSVAIVPDGGENWETETFAKGVQWIKLESHGQASHASRPWEGVNAISALVSALGEIEALAPKSDDKQVTSINIGTIEGGTTGNQIAAHASAMLDVRHGNMDDYESIYPRIHEICGKYGVEDTLIVSDPPCINDINNPYIKSFRTIIESVTGKQPGTMYSYGATDGRYFSAHNIPTVIVSPECGGRHSEAEWLSEKGFEQFAAVLEQFVMLEATVNSAERPAAKLLA